MELLILGPLEVRDGKGPVALGGPKPRAVLAVLALARGRAVSADELVMAVWGEDAPRDSLKKLQVTVSRLRAALGERDVIVTSAAGYRLQLEPGGLDLERFEEHVAAGRAALQRGNAADAAARFRAALALWRGPALADLATEAFVSTHARTLEEERLSALEAGITADLECGHEADLIGELGVLVDQHPDREAFVRQLMLALFRCGRQAEALETFRTARRRMLAAYGLEPSSALAELQDGVLRQDRALLGARAAELPLELKQSITERLEGRDAELAWLRERWDQASAGNGEVVTVAGEPGIGKSRLAAEFAAEAHARGAVVVFVDGAGPEAGTIAALERARATTRATLLVVDHARSTRPATREALHDAIAQAPVLVLMLGENGMPEPGSLLLLRPLDVGAVHAIVTRYAPASIEEPPPTADLLRRSRGVPGLVHLLAGEWADSAARQRVHGEARLTAARREALRTTERELAASVAVLEATRTHTRAPVDGAIVCPFKGLASFQVADAPYFFGRERLVSELIARLVGARMLGVIGPSGSGKSSVLRAGLLPALAQGMLPGSEAWPQLLIRPGTHPLRELREALTKHPGPDRVVAVDQFEEIFTLCDDADERAAFVTELAHLANAGEVRGAVALAIRSDFYGRCSEYPDLAALLDSSQVLVGPMGADDVRRAITCPAERAGLIVDPELTDALVADVSGEPGALPLLSTALLELWQRRDGRRLRYVPSESDHPVRDAVKRLGDQAFSQLSAPQQTVARNVLLALTTVDEDRVERRRVRIAELAPEAAEVVERLVDSRVLTRHEGTVELAHEALLREWPRLRGWIDEDRDVLRARARLQAGSRVWEELGHDSGALMRGAVLAEARARIAPDAFGLPGEERAFLAASIELDDRERAAGRRRLRVVVAGLSAGLVAFAAIAVTAIHQRGEARRERTVALSHSLALQSAQALATEPELALRLALEADEQIPTTESSVALRESTLAFRQLGTLAADGLSAQTAAYSPDGTQIVTAGDEGIARLWDARTRKRLAQRELGGAVHVARFTPDGRQIVFATETGAYTTNADLTGMERVISQPVTDVAPGADGFAATVEDRRADSPSGRVEVIGATGERTLAAGTPLAGVDMDGDGRIVTAGYDVTAEHDMVKLWAADGTLTAGLAAPAGIRDVRFSPDGDHVLAVGDGWGKLIDAANGTLVYDLRVGPRVLAAGAFNADGTRFATAGHDGSVRVWDTAGGSQLLELRGQLSRVFDVGFEPTGDRVVSAGDDGRARVWNAGGILSFTGDGEFANADYSPSGRWIATGGWDGAVRLWNPATGALVQTIRGPGEYAGAYFSPASDELVIGQDDANEVRMVTPPNGEPHVVATTGADHGINVAQYDPTGTRLVYADELTATIVVREMRTGREWRLRGGPPENVWDVQASPDGKQAVAGGENGVLYVWDLGHPSAPVRELTGHDGRINVLDYSPDGRVVTAGSDRTARVWNPDTGAQVVLRGHSDEVDTAVFTPDGARVLTASADGTMRLWDSRTGEPLATLQDTPDAPLSDVSQGPDGMLATLDDHQVVRVFRCTVCGTLDEVRAAARALDPRELTAAERERYLR